MYQHTKNVGEGVKDNSAKQYNYDCNEALYSRKVVHGSHKQARERDTSTAREKHLHGSQGTLARLTKDTCTARTTVPPLLFKTSTIKKQVKKQKMLAYFKQKHYFCPRIRQKDTPDL